MGNQPNKVRWVNVSGTLYLRDGRVIERGCNFLAHPDEVPEVFRDTVLLVDPKELEAAPELQSIKPAAPTYSIKTAGLPGKFNVVDGQGKAINERVLTAKGAKTLLESLS